MNTWTSPSSASTSRAWLGSWIGSSWCGAAWLRSCYWRPAIRRRPPRRQSRQSADDNAVPRNRVATPPCISPVSITRHRSRPPRTVPRTPGSIRPRSVAALLRHGAESLPSAMLQIDTCAVAMCGERHVELGRRVVGEVRLPPEDQPPRRIHARIVAHVASVPSDMTSMTRPPSRSSKTTVSAFTLPPCVSSAIENACRGHHEPISLVKMRNASSGVRPPPRCVGWARSRCASFAQRRP